MSIDIPALVAHADSHDAPDPIYDAVRRGDIVHVVALLAADPRRLNGCGDVFNSSAPLHVAAAHGQGAVASCLLHAGARVDELNEDGDTPLTYAVMRNRLALVKMLVARGADVNHRNGSGQTVRQAAGVAGNRIDQRILALV
jgi:ankyrin repeat protein